MTRKGICSLLLALIFVLACVPAFAEANDPITLTMFSFDQGIAAWDSPIHQEITARTGVTVDMEYTVTTNHDERVGVMIASDEYPDLINARGLNVPEKLIAAGALIPLDDLIEEHAPNIKAIAGDSLKKMRKSDGNLYVIERPQNRPEEIADANQCLFVQYDVLEKTGYPEIETLDDVHQMLKDYLEIVPDLDGQSFVPFGLWADDWGYNATLNNPALWVNGFVDDSDAYVDPETFEVTFFNATDPFKNYLKWLNTLYLDGMIDKNGFITKNDAWKSLVSSGRVLAMIDGTWDIADAEAALRGAGMYERLYARMPVVIEEGIQDRSQVYCESYTWGVGISKDCADPVRAIKFLDFMMSEEASVLLNWGVEGIHYDVIDGLRVQKPEITAKLNEDADYGWREGLTKLNWLCISGAAKLADGQYAAPFNPEQAYTQADAKTQEVMDHYGIKYWGQMFDTSGERTPYGFAWTLSLDAKSNGMLARQKADEMRHSVVPQIVMAPDDEQFEALWADFKKRLYDEAGIEAWEMEMTEALAQRLELWK